MVSLIPSGLSGRTITFQNIPVERWRDRLLKRGLPVQMANDPAALSELHNEERFDRMSDDVLALTGQRRLGVQEFLRKNAAVLTTW
jgi:hypothetical protein